MGTTCRGTAGPGNEEMHYLVLSPPLGATGVEEGQRCGRRCLK